MPDIHEYPWTEYSEGNCNCNMGCFMGLCKRVGVKLDVVGQNLQLLDPKNFVLSSVKIAWSQQAIEDELGNNITTYLIDAGTRDKFLVFSDGRGNETVITVPYSEIAKYTVDGDEINTFVKNFVIAGDQVQVQLGNGSSFNLTIPFARKSFSDVNEKPITSYAAGIEVQGNTVVLTDGQDRVIDTITVHFSETAAGDSAGNSIIDSYGASLQAGTTNVNLISKSGSVLSTIVVPYSISSSKDTEGNLFLHDYAETLQVNVDGKKMDLVAHDGTTLSSVRIPWSDLSEHANKAIETVQVIGNQVVFTTHDNSITRIEVPWSLKAVSDQNGNILDETYISDVRQDAVTGVISFYAQNGDVVATLSPSSRIAEYDTFDNLIGDFVKTLVFDNQSRYLVATHGTGTADQIRIEYATSAWKDDLLPTGNIIKNVYHKTLLIEEDNEGRWNLVGLNGEGSEITRLILPELTAAVGSGLVINQHNISLTNEVKERIYDFDYISADERLDISTHVLTT